MEQQIIIVGAGLVGCSLAMALNPAIKVTLLEKHLPDFTATHTDRPLTLSYGSQCILQRWGLWSALAEQAASIDVVHVSEQGRFGVAQFSAKQQAVPALGYVVSFNALHRVLYEALLQQTHVTLLQSHRIDAIDCDTKPVTLTFSNTVGQHQITAALLVAADGQASACRELLQIAVKHDENKGTASIMQLQLQTPHQRIAYERFTKMGTLAVLPLHDEMHARLVWTMTTAQAAVVATWSEQDVLQHIQQVFSGRLQINTATQAHTFPLQTTIARQQIKPGCVLLGNAAHSIFPIAAQGFNLGLRDVRGLSELLNEAALQQRPLGDMALLQRYLHLRESDQKQIAGITKGTLDLFEWSVPGLGALRGLGLLSLDMLRPLKSRFAKRLMGVR